jgi:hypothetical protein
MKTSLATLDVVQMNVLSLVRRLADAAVGMVDCIPLAFFNMSLVVVLSLSAIITFANEMRPDVWRVYTAVALQIIALVEHLRTVFAPK